MLNLRRGVVRFTFAAFVAATLATPAAADPIQITSGFIAPSGVQDVMSRGFLRAIVFDFSTEEFRLRGGESDGSTQQVLWPHLSRVATLFTPGAETFVFIDFGLFTVTATPSLSPSPFDLTGRLRILDGSAGMPGPVLFDDTVFGQGIATWQWAPTPSGGLVLSGARYDFSDTPPVPEPVSLLLVGTGLTVIAIRRRAAR